MNDICEEVKLRREIPPKAAMWPRILADSALQKKRRTCISNETPLHYRTTATNFRSDEEKRACESGEGLPGRCLVGIAFCQLISDGTVCRIRKPSLLDPLWFSPHSS